MKTLYIECNMGAAGDMLTASLLEHLSNKDEFIAKVNNIGLHGVHVSHEKSIKHGVSGTHINVEIHGTHEHDHHHHHEESDHHHHSGLHEIEHIIEDLNVSDKVKTDALAIYKIIADAESAVHGQPVGMVHFHEVGMLDAVADIVGVCMLMEQLLPNRVVASPICVGFGEVRCAHGILPVPAPATALILKGIPAYAGNVRGELCTPTGAAILKYFVDEFADMPIMTTESIGYGMGTKDFEKANCVRTFWGTSNKSVSEPNDTIVELSCNLDDMTGEDMGAALNMLLKEGALDVLYIPAYMKKNRPGNILLCLCKPCDADKFAALILKYTTTFGVRKNVCDRYILDRTFEKTQTPYGQVTQKKGVGYGVEKTKLEHDEVVTLEWQ